MSNHEKLNCLILKENFKALIIPALVLVVIVSIFGVFFSTFPYAVKSFMGQLFEPGSPKPKHGVISQLLLLSWKMAAL
jgi:hypothetical protein